MIEAYKLLHEYHHCPYTTKYAGGPQNYEIVCWYKMLIKINPAYRYNDFTVFILIYFFEIFQS